MHDGRDIWQREFISMKSLSRKLTRQRQATLSRMECTDYLCLLVLRKTKNQCEQSNTDNYYMKKVIGGEGVGYQLRLAWNCPDGLYRRSLFTSRRNRLHRTMIASGAAPESSRLRQLNICEPCGRERGRSAGIYPVEFDGASLSFLGQGETGRPNHEGMADLNLAGRNSGRSAWTRVAYVRFIDDFPAFPFNNVWD